MASTSTASSPLYQHWRKVLFLADSVTIVKHRRHANATVRHAASNVAAIHFKQRCDHLRSTPAEVPTPGDRLGHFWAHALHRETEQDGMHLVNWGITHPVACIRQSAAEFVKQRACLIAINANNAVQLEWALQLGGVVTLDGLRLATQYKGQPIFDLVLRHIIDANQGIAWCSAQQSDATVTHPTGANLMYFWQCATLSANAKKLIVWGKNGASGNVDVCQGVQTWLQCNACEAVITHQKKNRRFLRWLIGHGATLTTGCMSAALKTGNGRLVRWMLAWDNLSYSRANIAKWVERRTNGQIDAWMKCWIWALKVNNALRVSQKRLGLTIARATLRKAMDRRQKGCKAA